MHLNMKSFSYSSSPISVYKWRQGIYPGNMSRLWQRLFRLRSSPEYPLLSSSAESRRRMCGCLNLELWSRVTGIITFQRLFAMLRAFSQHELLWNVIRKGKTLFFVAFFVMEENTSYLCEFTIFCRKYKIRMCVPIDLSLTIRSLKGISHF